MEVRVSVAKDGHQLRGLLALLAATILFFLPSTLSAMGARPLEVPESYARLIDEEVSFLEVVNYNVGNVGVDLRLPGFKCPKFKLCWSWTVEALRDWFEEINADVILLQETMGIEQVLGEEWYGPLVSKDVYEGECLDHTCVLWRKEVVRRTPTECSSYDGPYGKLLNCELSVSGQTLQAVSAYYPAVNIVFADVEERRNERSIMAKVLFEGEGDIIDPNAPLIVGGDFNSGRFTYRNPIPYPNNFYTLFGRHFAGHGLAGLKAGPQTQPLHTFFGIYDEQRPRSLATHYAFGHYSQFDQVFANFGFPLKNPEAQICPGHACLEGDGGLPALREIRPGQDGTDHEGIFARIGWKNATH